MNLPPLTFPKEKNSAGRESISGKIEMKAKPMLKAIIRKIIIRFLLYDLKESRPYNKKSDATKLPVILIKERCDKFASSTEFAGRK